MPTESVRHTARQMLALIALADLPTPTSIVVDEERSILNLSYDTIADGAAWAIHLGTTATTPAEHDGRRWLRTRAMPQWHGWAVSLHACEELAACASSPFDADTSAQLRQIAEGGGSA